MDEKRNVANVVSDSRSKTPLHPGSVALRRAVRRNIVSFPSQIPVFLKQRPAGIEWRAVLLFFVRGWSSPRVAARFHVPVHQIWQILEDWSVRALALGYVQVIDQAAFEECCRAHMASGAMRQAEAARPAQDIPAPWSVPQPPYESIPAVSAVVLHQEVLVSHATA
jgi:hypothetical protein